MTLPELCIRRPVFATMLILLPVTLGILAYTKLGVDLFPNVDLPIVTVTVTRPGTSVEEMETGVTKVLEEAVNTISGIDELRSVTKEGIATLNVTFVLEKNRDVAQQEVQSKINTILTRLPPGTENPIIDKFDLDASPVMTVAISGRRSLREVTEIADKRIKESISSLPGVGAVTVAGGHRRAISVVVDTRKLEAYNLSIEQVRRALSSQNLELPGGRVDQQNRELVLRTMGRVRNAAEFEGIIITNINGQPIRIADVGHATDAVEEPRSVGRLNGDNAVMLIVQKQSGTNTVAVIDGVKARLAQIEHGLAEEGRGDVRMEVIRDQSRFINATLHEVNKHLVLGAILVSLTIILFLRDWRTMIIASLSIPVSIISTFMVMQWLGFTLNNISMLALVMAVGIVIDDAVVVHENIFRWMEEKGMGAWEAALGATREIALAVMATTFSLVVIFLPIAFMHGRVGRFFYSFGVTMAIGILMSMLVSFTLTPMLCSRFLKLSAKAKQQGKAHHSGGIYGWLIEAPYLFALRWALRYRFIVILAGVLVTASLFPIPRIGYPGLVAMVGIDFLPKDDQSEFEITITTPEGWTLDRTDRTFREIEDKIRRQLPGVTHILTTIGDTSGKVARGQGEVTRGSIYLRLVDLEDRTFSYQTAFNDMAYLLRKRPGYVLSWGEWWREAKQMQPVPPGTRGFDQFEYMGMARRIMADYPDLRASVQIPQAVSSGQVNAEIEFTLVGPDLSKLMALSERIVSTLRENPGLADVDTTLALRKPEVRVEVNRERASDLGVSIQTVASTLRTLVGGEIVSDFRDDQLGELYDVWLRAEGTDRHDRAALERLSVPSTKAGLIELGNVARIGEDQGPAQIDRYNRQRKISLIANLAGMPTNKAQDAFLEAFKQHRDDKDINAGPEYAMVASGRAKTQNESNQAFFMAFAFSLIFMYMILAAQFESFVHPITILLAVPITIPFALLSLLFLGQALSLYSILGIFLLFGIVKKNGILQVDYANVLRQRVRDGEERVPEPYATPDWPEDRRPGMWERWVKRRPEAKRTQLWAVMEANRTRLRPILMTTLMLIAGMVPIALGEGPGSATRAAMAKVIVGGQALSLLLSLLITPVGYSMFDDWGMWWKKPRRKPSPQPAFEPEPPPAIAEPAT